MLRLTAAQVVKVNASIRSLCANCNSNGNCLLLSENGPERCVQTQSLSLLCNYYIHCVLPADKELYTALYSELINKKLYSYCKNLFLLSRIGQSIVLNVLSKRIRKPTG